jgi:uncharacterized membrane protein YedE/YeeE
MTIDWLHFTPWSSLAGGMLLGLAASLLILLSGRIAGISGILGGLLRPAPGDTLWRLLFLFGLLVSPLVYGAFLPVPSLHIDAGAGALVAAGLLVGIGTRYGSGCTSGHGVCGIARRSPRSMAATALFVFAGFVTVYLLRHVFA